MSVSPFSTDEPLDLSEIVSAESRLAASSNDDDVRVEASKNTLRTVRPRSVGSFLTSRSATASKPAARLQQALHRGPVEILAGEQVSRAGDAHGGRLAEDCGHLAPVSRTTSSAASSSPRCTRTRSAREVGRFLPTTSARIGSSRCPRSHSTASRTRAGRP